MKKKGRGKTIEESWVGSGGGEKEGRVKDKILFFKPPNVLYFDFSLHSNPKNRQSVSQARFNDEILQLTHFFIFITLYIQIKI